MLLDVLALVLGIWLSIRKLDIRRREPADHPGVDLEAFDRWKRLALGAYNLGSLACFGKLVLDYLLQLAAPKLGVPWTVIRVGGLVLFLAWVVILATVWVWTRRARRLQDELGLTFPARAPQE